MLNRPRVRPTTDASSPPAFSGTSLNAETPIAPPRRAAVAFILITVLLDVIALGIIIPVFPTLITAFMGGDTPRAAYIYGIFGTAWALMQFLFSPVIGALSDRIGRRPIVLISNFGLGLDYIIMALSPTVWWLLAGRIISGITAASISTAGAYIADVTPPEKRAASFGLIGAMFGVGFVLGPALGGVLGSIDPRLPFWVAAALSLLNGVYGFFVLPESLAKENRKAFSWKRANPVGSLRLLRSHRELFGIASVYFLNMLSHNALPSVFVLYTTYRYGWDEKTVGLTLAGYGILTVIVQGAVVKRAVAKFGERRAMLIGLAAAFACFTIYGFAPTQYWFWGGSAIAALWGFFGPASQGLMTRRVGATEQGQLQGALASISGITGLIGPLIFTVTFAYAIRPERDVHVPGAPMLLAAVIIAIAAALALRVTRPAATA